MILNRNRIVALGVAGALAIGLAVSAGPVLAAPVSSNTATLKQIDVSNVVEAQWGRRGYRRNAAPWVAGAALGIIGGAVASQMYHDNYYDDGYAYGPYGYGTPYPMQPSYGYAPYGGYAPYRSCDNASTC
jgi:hypothetical protein